MAAEFTVIWTAPDGRERVVYWSDRTVDAQYLIAGEWKVRPGDREALCNALVALHETLNTPEIVDAVKGIATEAMHQRARWSTDHDAGKTNADWFWLIGYLAGKALHNPLEAGDAPDEKRLHRIVMVAAAALNWHASVLGRTIMRPGISPPDVRS